MPECIGSSCVICSLFSTSSFSSFLHPGITPKGE
jgi:hypothetical protein